ncbi:MAG TPA: hypothetical protein VNM72_01415 [Blastocatellia bacterium]|nr:hypothetical protein [Blastocatellia bacterium]
MNEFAAICSSVLEMIPKNIGPRGTQMRKPPIHFGLTKLMVIPKAMRTNRVSSNPDIKFRSNAGKDASTKSLLTGRLSVYLNKRLALSIAPKWQPNHLIQLPGFRVSV